LENEFEEIKLKNKIKYKQLIELYCGHVYNEKCIKDWIEKGKNKNFNCPDKKCQIPILCYEIKLDRN
jgi:hypothetical protein